MRTLSMVILVCFFMYFPKFSFAFGDVVYDPTVDETLTSSFAIELANTTNTVTQLLNQIILIKQELARLDNSNWNLAQDKINELGSKVNQANTLAYSAGNIDSNFRRVFPGYQASGATNYTGQYKDIVTTTQNTLNSILQSIGMSASDFAKENDRLRILQTQSQNANGQTQAIQAASQIASAEVEQLQLIRQTIIAQTNAQTAYYAAQTQKEASTKATLDNFLDTSKQSVDGRLDKYPLDSKF